MAIDIGGTFTDVVCLSGDGSVRHTKVFTTADDLSEAILDGLHELGVKLSEVRLFLHGTTVVVNSLLEGKIPVTGLLTTEGFRDVLEIMRSNNLRMYDLQQEKPDPLVPRALRLEVDERLDSAGNVVRPLREEQVRMQLSRLLEHGVQALAVCFLYSYVNPLHERRVKALVEREFPIHISISSDVAPEWREFERTSATVLNVCAMPSIVEYTRRVRQRLSGAGLSVRPLIMQSNGGVMTVDEAIVRPIATYLSGPVGGVMAAARVARGVRLSDCISLDMGGTSADMGLILGGQPRMTSDSSIGGWPVLGQMVDIKTIGAGGGSIVHLDADGAFKVGPESAGANPGPACYGRGGHRATITDANFVLNRIDWQYFLGGRVKIDPMLSRRAFQPIADRLELPLEQVAAGAVEVVNANLAQAIREITVERGYDVREFALIAFGGNGGLHASAIGRELGLGRVIVPPVPGNLSAFGILTADLRHDLVRMWVTNMAAVTAGQINRALGELREEGVSRLLQDGIESEAIEVHCAADLRYQGQMHTLSVPVAYPITKTPDMTEKFAEVHRRVNGYTMEGSPIELICLRVAAVGRTGDVAMAGAQAAGGLGDGEAPVRGTRQVYLENAGKSRACRVFHRTALGVGQRIRGPAVIEEPTATILVLDGDEARVDVLGNVVMELAGGAR